MAQSGAVAHADATGLTVADRVQGGGYLYYTILGENLAMNGGYKNPAETAVAGWMRSQRHREYLLDAEFTETGVGVVIRNNLVYFTQFFGNPAPTPSAQ